MAFKKFSYEEHAKASDPLDFWGQVKRTVDGKPVGETQIALIESAVAQGLELCADDVVFDIGCGNGALSDRIFANCRGGLGVDASEYLISVARKHFGARAGVEYQVANAADLVHALPDPERFTKLLCYGAFMYLSDPEAQAVLSGVRRRFSNVERCFLGNLPNRDRALDFYYPSEYVAGIEDCHETAIGMWRSEQQIQELAARTGWTAAIRRMPPDFSAASYRYDVVLTRTLP